MQLHKDKSQGPRDITGRYLDILGLAVNLRRSPIQNARLKVRVGINTKSAQTLGNHALILIHKVPKNNKS